MSRNLKVMKKFIFLLFLVVMSISGYSQSNTSDVTYLDVEGIKNTFDTMASQTDTIIYCTKEISKILIREVKNNGLKNTIIKGKDTFLPIVIVLILYLLWLKNRKK